MKKQRSVFLIMLFCLFSTFGVFEASAEIYGGDCGSECVWSVDTVRGELKISGKGAMKDYANIQEMPWLDYLGEIQTLTVEEGIFSCFFPD